MFNTLDKSIYFKCVSGLFSTTKSEKKAAATILLIIILAE